MSHTVFVLKTTFCKDLAQLKGVEERVIPKASCATKLCGNLALNTALAGQFSAVREAHSNHCLKASSALFIGDTFKVFQIRIDQFRTIRAKEYTLKCLGGCLTLCSY